jgi:hypothetical protein
LRYLASLDYRYHQEVLEELLELISNGELPFSYQVAATVETMKYLSPSNPRRLASQLRLIGFRKNNHWYVRQKTVETIAVLPYTDNSAERLATRALEDESPWVRRAGALLVVRGNFNWVRKKIDILCYHADPDVARVGLYWKRHLENPQSVALAFGGMPSTMDDKALIRKLPMIYLLRSHRDPSVGNRLYKFLESTKSRNSVIRWHRKSLMDQLSRWLSPRSGVLPFLEQRNDQTGEVST